MLRLLILFILPSVGHAFDVLPEAFSWQEPRQAELCSNPNFRHQDYWRSITSEKIESLIIDYAIERDHSLVANSLVTLSYEAIFNHTSKSEFASTMGYIYANASHHLGRLVRYSFWPKDSPLGNEDTSFIRGSLLQIAAVIAPKTLADKLMIHSLDLYKELSWVLSAASICGNQYAADLVKTRYLQDAFSSRSTDEFIYHFIAHEQHFLQRGMYQDPLINLIAKLGVLDKMRFITFNGEIQSSFYDWCKETRCQTTSFNPEQRINFDRVAIAKEAKKTWWQSDILQQRLLKTRANEIAHFILRE